ncbi:hypothetical protein [Sphingobacterium sp. Ag1]|uniref:hypothetical protein n=1 Tax=Sphingobacterium sp. Ag1 TaxID=1643451 RepID=UPI0012E0AD95|nr:hypothetical protein [Sphingobacterium sp. Ag1]
MELVVSLSVYEQNKNGKIGKYVLNNNLEHDIITYCCFLIEKLTDYNWTPVSLSEMLAFEDITYNTIKTVKRISLGSLKYSKVQSDRTRTLQTCQRSVAAWTGEG